MAFKPFRKIRLVNEEDLTTKNINAIQDQIGAAVGQLLGKDTLDSSLLTEVKLKANITNKIAHNLGRHLNGWVVVRLRGSAPSIYDTQDSNPSPHLLLWLVTSADITVDILVF